MDFVVRCITPQSARDPVYHLLDGEGSLLLVASVTAKKKPDDIQQLRLARPDGKIQATIELAPSATASNDERSGADYALVHDFAVYAILSEHHRAATGEASEVSIYFTVEVEGEHWLALAHPELPACFVIYDEIPAGLKTYNKLTELDLPPAIGRLCTRSDDTCFDVELEPRRLQQTGLLVLALSFLIDRACGPD